MRSCAREIRVKKVGIEKKNNSPENIWMKNDPLIANTGFLIWSFKFTQYRIPFMHVEKSCSFRHSGAERVRGVHSSSTQRLIQYTCCRCTYYVCVYRMYSYLLVGDVFFFFRSHFSSPKKVPLSREDVAKDFFGRIFPPFPSTFFSPKDTCLRLASFSFVLILATDFNLSPLSTVH